MFSAKLPCARIRRSSTSLPPSPTPILQRAPQPADAQAQPDVEDRGGAGDGERDRQDHGGISSFAPMRSHGAAMLATAREIAIGGSLHARASGREASGPTGR